MMFQSAQRRLPRRAQALAEFAVVSFVLLLILAATITFGQALFGAQVLQQAADVAAQEIARTPLPPDASFEQGLAEVFDETFLVVRASELEPSQSLADYMVAKNAPLLNRLLVPLMIQETVYLDDDNDPTILYRYPGAIVRNTSPPSEGGTQDGLTVLIPRLEGQSLIFYPVIHEVVDAQTSFSLIPSREIPEDESLSEIDSGVVFLRINYPYQAGTLVSYRYQRDETPIPLSEALRGEQVDNIPIIADDEPITLQENNYFSISGTEIQSKATGQTYELVICNNSRPPGGPNIVNNVAHSGKYGLGSFDAHLTQVRPFRRVITAQAIYRREVFSGE